MTSATTVTSGKKRGRRRHQTVIEQSNGLDRVFIWDIDGSLVPSDMIGQALEPSVLPSVVDKLGNLSKRLREITLSFCDEHMFLSEVEASDQMHIDDIPKDLDQANPIMPTTGSQQPNQLGQQQLTPAPPATPIHQQPLTLANQQEPQPQPHQQQSNNGYSQDHYTKQSTTPSVPAQEAYANYHQQPHQFQLEMDPHQQQEHQNQAVPSSYQPQLKVEANEHNYIYSSNPTPASLVDDISVNTTTAAAAYVHSGPDSLWIDPNNHAHHHHFQAQNHHHHHHHHHHETHYPFEQSHYHQPTMHYQQHEAPANEQNGMTYHTDFGQQSAGSGPTYADYHFPHQQHLHTNNNHQQQQDNQHHQQEASSAALAGYQSAGLIEEPPKYLYSNPTSLVEDISVNNPTPVASAYAQSEPLWLEHNNNQHHFLTPTHNEQSLYHSFESQTHHELVSYQPMLPAESHHVGSQHSNGSQLAEQNGNGYQEFALPTPMLTAYSEYQQQQHHNQFNHHLSHQQDHQQQQQQQQHHQAHLNQNNEQHQQEPIRPASNLQTNHNNKLQATDPAAFLSKPLKNVLGNHHSRLAYKLSVRYNRIKTIYNNFRFDLKAKDAKLHDELETILTEIDRYTLDWRKRSMDCLKLILESNNCTNLIVTKLPLVVALGHLICLNLGQYFHVDQIYSAIRTNSKEACIKRIKKRFGATNRCSYIIVGDREDIEMAKKLSLPSWITTRSDGHRQLLQLYTALKEGYLM